MPEEHKWQGIIARGKKTALRLKYYRKSEEERKGR
jgi:hypothetical protein